MQCNGTSLRRKYRRTCDFMPDRLQSEQTERASCTSVVIICITPCVIKYSECFNVVFGCIPAWPMIKRWLGNNIIKLWVEFHSMIDWYSNYFATIFKLCNLALHCTYLLTVTCTELLAIWRTFYGVYACMYRRAV